MMKAYIGWIRGAILIGGLFLLSQVSGIFLPIVIAIVLSFILNPLVELITTDETWP